MAASCSPNCSPCLGLGGLVLLLRRLVPARSGNQHLSTARPFREAAGGVDVGHGGSAAKMRNGIPVGGQDLQWFAEASPVRVTSAAGSLR